MTPSSRMRSRRIRLNLSERSRSARSAGVSRPERCLRKIAFRSGRQSPKPTDLAILFRERHQIGNRDRLELLRQVIDLPVGHGEESPVLLPALVVEHLDAIDLGLEVAACSAGGW